jgi:hypothetical protein
MQEKRSASMLATASVCLAISGTARAQEPPASSRARDRPDEDVHPSRFVRVHIEGASGVTVDRDTPLGWRTVCAGTCDAMLATDASYRIDGATLFPSSPFTLRGAPGESETLQVRGASEPLFVLGILGVVGSGAVMSITWPIGAYWGLCVAGTGLSGGSASSLGGCVPPGSQGLLTAFLVSGAVALVSTVLVAGNFKTSVEQLFPGVSASPVVGAASKAPAAQSLVALPTPSWKETLSDLQLQAPVMGVPVLQGRF